MVHPLVTALKRMKNEGLYDEMSLNRLDANDTRGVIYSIFTEAEFPESFIELVYDESEGNPLFIIEMLKLLSKMEVLTRAEHGWKLSSKVSRIEVPSKVNDVIMNRLDSMSREERNIVEVASIEGQRFGSDTLCHCLELPRMKVLRLLQDLEDSHHLIHASKKDYHFDHIKIREVVYDGLMPELRVEYHRLIGEHLRKSYDEGEYAAKIAHHMLEAGEEREAIPYLLKAGDHAKSLFANEEAIGYFDNGIGIVDKHMEQNPDPDLQRMKLPMLKGRADVRMLIGQYDGARVDFKCLAEVAQELGDKKECASGLKGIGDTFWRTGDYKDALEYFKESLKISKEIGNREGEGSSLFNIGGIHYEWGDYEEALECMEESLRISREIGNRRGEGYALNHIGIIHECRGNYEEALECYEESLKISREIGNRVVEGYALNNIGGIHDHRGNYEEALEYYKESLKISREIGDRLVEGRTLNNIGEFYRDRGNYEEALEYYEKSLKISREIGDRLVEGSSVNNIGEIYRNRGDYKEALECLEESLKISREIRNRHRESDTLNNIGLVHMSRGNYGEAFSYIEQAINIRKEIGDKPGQLISQHELCKLWVDVGDQERLLEGLEKAVQLANELDTKRIVTA
jgi:tetratricopeptide (TPR) repeat protein